jgi:hypothetical protein
MSTYTGTFTVINNTGATITYVAVTHATTDFGPNTVKAASLEQGQSTQPTPLTTSTSNTDRWSVAFVNGAGQVLCGLENCGFESEDDKGNVRVVLNYETFDIDMPQSSSCQDNDYDQT